MQFFALSVAMTSLLAGIASAAPAPAPAPAATTTATATASATSGDSPIVVPAVSCAPKSTCSTAPPVSWKRTAKGRKSCEPAIFNTKPAENPQYANWRFCVALFSDWASYNGTFSVARSGASNGTAAADGLIPLVQYESCTLAVKTRNSEADGYFALGDLDVDDILNRALSEFSSGTDLFAAGTVNCAVGNGKKAALSWQIYDPTTPAGYDEAE